MNRFSAWTLVLLLLLTPATTPLPSQPATPPQIAGCGVFPADNIWNAPIDDLPVDANSAAYIDTIGADKPLHPDFGAGLWEGAPIGIPYTTVLSSQAGVNVTFLYDDESDPGPYPVPPGAQIEGGPRAIASWEGRQKRAKSLICGKSTTGGSKWSSKLLKCRKNRQESPNISRN